MFKWLIKYYQNPPNNRALMSVYVMADSEMQARRNFLNGKHDVNAKMPVLVVTL